MYGKLIIKPDIILLKEFIKLNGHDNKNCNMCRIKYKYCECCLKYTNVKSNLIEYQFLRCNKNYKKTFDENLKKGFANTHKFADHDINKFIA